MTAQLWIGLLAAMTMVESSGNPNAYNAKEQAVGPLQVRAACLADVNEYAGTDVQLADCYNPTVARWVVVQYAKRYNARTPEEVARLWNSGPAWRTKTRKTDGYWGKVKKEMDK